MAALDRVPRRVEHHDVREVRRRFAREALPDREREHRAILADHEQVQRVHASRRLLDQVQVSARERVPVDDDRAVPARTDEPRVGRKVGVEAASVLEQRDRAVDDEEPEVELFESLDVDGPVNTNRIS